MGDIETLLEDIKKTHDHDGSKFKIIATSDSFIRFRFYSDSSGETYEIEEGYTDDDERYSGDFGIYERYQNRSSVEPYNWDSEVLKTLCDRYCAQRTSFNFYTAWFYWHLTGRVLEEIWGSIVISDEHIDFFRVDPELVLPKTREAMTDRCIEEIPKIRQIHDMDSEYFSGYYDGEGILGEDRIFDEASSCDDGRTMTRRDEVIKELKSVPHKDLKGKLKRAIKEAITIRLTELRKDD